MSKIIVLLGNGYEEIEALTVVDFCRRAGIEVDTVSITGSLETMGDHNIKVMADKLIEDIDLSQYEAVVTPGGYPGTMMLKGDEKVLKIIKMFYDENKLVASICASPLVLDEADISKKIAGTIYPGMEGMLTYKEFKEDLVVVDKNVITSRGPCTAPLFAFAIIEYLEGKEVSDKIKNETLYNLIGK